MQFLSGFDAAENSVLESDFASVQESEDLSYAVAYSEPVTQLGGYGTQSQSTEPGTRMPPGKAQKVESLARVSPPTLLFRRRSRHPRRGRT
jgi:hypothetical protein